MYWERTSKKRSRFFLFFHRAALRGHIQNNSVNKFEHINIKIFKIQ